MKILISGYRNFNDYDLFVSELDKIITIQQNIRIIHGGCKGADALADRYAEERGFENAVYLPDWSLGLKAGPMRNRKMIDDENPDIVLAFLHKDSKGAKNCIELAKRRKIKTIVIDI